MTPEQRSNAAASIGSELAAAGGDQGAASQIPLQGPARGSGRPGVRLNRGLFGCLLLEELEWKVGKEAAGPQRSWPCGF